MFTSEMFDKILLDRETDEEEIEKSYSEFMKISKSSIDKPYKISILNSNFFCESFSGRYLRSI